MYHILCTLKGLETSPEMCTLKNTTQLIYEDPDFNIRKKEPGLYYIQIASIILCHTACISFWIPKRQAISTDNSFIFKKINEN